MGALNRTPGKWIVGIYETTDAFKQIPQHICICAAETMELIATCGPIGDEKSLIDAKLFSSAPEMYDALEAAKNYLDKLSFGYPGLLMDKIEAALAKADGGYNGIDAETQNQG